MSYLTLNAAETDALRMRNGFAYHQFKGEGEATFTTIECEPSDDGLMVVAMYGHDFNELVSLGVI
jgi:hypothetical protein